MTRRQDRVGDLVRSELSRILLREMHDPRVRLASVSSVDMSPDLRYARVGVSILGDEPDRQSTIEALERARGFVRKRLAVGLKGLRVIPELRFEIDRGAEHSQQISDLLERIDDDE